MHWKYVYGECVYSSHEFTIFDTCFMFILLKQNNVCACIYAHMYVYYAHDVFVTENVM